VKRQYLPYIYDCTAETTFEINVQIYKMFLKNDTSNMNNFLLVLVGTLLALNALSSVSSAELRGNDALQNLFQWIVASGGEVCIINFMLLIIKGKKI